MNSNRVVITGVSSLSSLGFSNDSLWKSILNEDLSITNEEIKVDGLDWEHFFMHKVKNFDINNFEIGKKYINDIKELEEI